MRTKKVFQINVVKRANSSSLSYGWSKTSFLFLQILIIFLKKYCNKQEIIRPYNNFFPVWPRGPFFFKIKSCWKLLTFQTQIISCQKVPGSTPPIVIFRNYLQDTSIFGSFLSTLQELFLNSSLDQTVWLQWLIFHRK